MSHVLHSPDRMTGAIALVVTAGTHIPLIGDHLREAPYVGWLFIVLSVAALALAVVLTVADTPAVWALSGAVCLAALIAFVASRTVGLPQIGDDVGNWTEALSYPALVAELIVVAASVGTWRASRTYAVPAPSSRRP